MTADDDHHRSDAPVDDGATGPTDPTDPDADRGQLVDWVGTGRRVRRTAAVVAVLVVVAWLVAGLLGGGLRLADLGDWAAVGIGVVVLGEVIVVGGAAVRAERRAAVRGERLGSDDVGLLPPRLPRPSAVLGSDRPVAPTGTVEADGTVDPDPTVAADGPDTGPDTGDGSGATDV